MATFLVFVWVCMHLCACGRYVLIVNIGHTACLWQGDKILIYGGENEHREYLSDVVIFDLKTAHWTQPDIRGHIPKGRARHAAAVYDDKLYVVGGLAGTETYTLDEICYLDLRTWAWSRSWSFVGRYDHSTWVWGGRIWVFGGMGPDMERTGELWWLDLKSSPAFKSAPVTGTRDSSTASSRVPPSPRSQYTPFNQPHHVITGSTGYTANSSSVQVRASSMTPKPIAPGDISSIKFVSGPNVPSQALGTHYHVYSSGTLLDFVTSSDTIRPSECNLSSLELDSFRWRRLAEGPEIFDPGYRWHYCAMNEDGTKAWLLGCATESRDNGAGAFEAYLSDVLPIDLRKFGLLGNGFSPEPNGEGHPKMPASDTHATSNVSGLGVDLAAMFDQIPESGSGTDFIVTGERDESADDDSMSAISTQTVSEQQHFMASNALTSSPIHVHKLILQARWPHFNRVYASQMAEFHTKKMHIPEPYSVVRAFLYYLYTDSIVKHPEFCASLGDVAGLLVMSNVYDMPRLRLLCIHRLSRELDVEHSAVVWERAGTAGEEWLKRRAATFCLTHWGRIVRTDGFKKLSRQCMTELCEAVDIEGRVIGGEELEVIGGLGGGKIGVGGSGRGLSNNKANTPGIQLGEEVEEAEVEEDDGMELN